MNLSLLHQLLPDDIQWLLSHSEQQMLQPEMLLSNMEHSVACAVDDRPKIHLILEGSLTLALLYHSSNSQQEPQPQDLFPLQGGDLWGAIPFVSQFLPSGRIKTLTPTLMLSLEKACLEQKLLSDQAFAARFYRLLTQLLVQRLKDLQRRCPYNLAMLKQLQLKEASTLFAALEDSDLDWLVAVGQVREYRVSDRITRLRQPLEDLHIVLDGSLGLIAPEQDVPPIYAAFLPPQQLPREIEFSRLSRGELLGDSFLVDPTPPAYAAQALRPTQLLAIPRWRLETKLLYDSHFSAKLYRVLSIVLASKQHSLLSSLGFELPMQELDDQLLHQVNLAESRFDWLTQRLQARSSSASLTAIAASS